MPGRSRPTVSFSTAGPAMLVVRGEKVFGGGCLGLAAAIGRTWSAFVVHKRGLLFDSRFVPPEPGPAANDQLVFVSEGTLELCAPIVKRFEGPVVLQMSEAQFEGAHGRRTIAFRTSGARFTSLQLRLAPGALRLPAVDHPEVVPTGEGLWPLVARTLEAEDAELPRRAHDVIAALAASGLVDAERLEPDELPPRSSLVRLARAAIPSFARLDALSTTQALADSSGVSLRTFGRELRGFFDAVPFLGRSFRDLALRSRFKLAVHGLSADGVDVAEVARLCGYGSSEAMARAFRDAGQPAPSEVRRILRQIVAASRPSGDAA